MSERQAVTTTIYGFDHSDSRELLSDFLASVSAAIETVPPEFRGGIEIVGETGYEDYVPRYRIEYTRPETDEEMAEREARSRAYAAEARRVEIEMLARLKAKYGE